MNYPDIEFFRQLLKSSLYVSWLHYGLAVLVIAMLEIIDYVYFKKQQRYCKGKKAKKKKPFDVADGLFLMSLTIATVMVIHDTVNILTDLHDDSYICIYAEYDVSGNPRHLYYGKNSSVNIYTEDGVIHMKRPKTLESFGQYERENFSAGTCYGTVWYAEHSKIILSFTPDDR